MTVYSLAAAFTPNYLQVGLSARPVRESGGSEMHRLSIRLLGSFQVMRDGKTAVGFDSDKVRALLAYLVVEAACPHRREVLAGLLWPEWPDRSARTSLRRALRA